MRVLLPLKNQAQHQNSPANPSSPSAAEPSPDAVEEAFEGSRDSDSTELEGAEIANSAATAQHTSVEPPVAIVDAAVQSEAVSVGEKDRYCSSVPESRSVRAAEIPFEKGSEAEEGAQETAAETTQLSLKRRPDSGVAGKLIASAALESKAPTKKQKQSDGSDPDETVFDSRVRQYKEAIMVERKPRSPNEEDQEHSQADHAYTDSRYVSVRENTPDSPFTENAPASAFKENNPSAPFKEKTPPSALDEDTSAEDEYTQFETALKQRGLEIREQEGDGNCLFRAVSLQIYGDSSSHAEIRRRCLDFMSRDEAHFSQFVTDEPFRDYISRKRHDGVHGNNPEIQAISELFNRPVEVFVPENGAQPLNIFHEEYKTGDAPIRLSYHDGSHYNAVIDPLCPTAGLGLGLPGLEPGLADRMQVAKAVEESDKLADEAELEKAREASHNDQLQRALKESTASVARMHNEKAMVLSDLEATEIELEQAAIVSSMESYQHGELGRKPAWSSSDRIDQDSDPAENSSRESRAQNDSASISGSGFTSSTHAAAQSHAAASVASAVQSYDNEETFQPQDEYPQTVQELVMNGFELSKVVHAYDLIGDNFDELLTFLMSSTR